MNSAVPRLVFGPAGAWQKWLGRALRAWRPDAVFQGFRAFRGLGVTGLRGLGVY